MTPCDKIQESLAAEALETAPTAEIEAHLAVCAACRDEAESFRRLAASIQDLEMEDPGELFFSAQRKKIRESLVETPARKSFRWQPALGLAAAALLLFIGLSRWQQGEKPSNFAWSTSMLVLSAGQASVTGSGILELETLNPEQLEGLAKNMELRILGGQGDELLDNGDDMQELSGPELDQLIQRLKATTGGQA